MLIFGLVLFLLTGGSIRKFMDFSECVSIE